MMSAEDSGKVVDAVTPGSDPSDPKAVVSGRAAAEPRRPTSRIGGRVPEQQGQGDEVLDGQVLDRIGVIGQAVEGLGVGFHHPPGGSRGSVAVLALGHVVALAGGLLISSTRHGRQGRRAGSPHPLDPSRARTVTIYHRGMTEAIAFTPFDAYLDGEQGSERRHDLVGGRVYAMAGGSERHDLAAGLIYELLALGAREKGCRPFTSNRLVRTHSGNAYHPDVMVACGPAPHRLYEQDPVLVIEVLSPSTASVDRREKAVAYAEATSLRLLMLVDPDTRRIELARPSSGIIDAWEACGPGDVVATEFGDIDVDALYDAIDRTATTS